MATAEILSPLYETARLKKAEFATVAGWRMVDRYPGAERDASTLQRSVTVVDASHHGKLLVEGRAAADRLQSAWQAPELSTGGGAEVEAADEQRVYLFRLRQDLFFVATPPGQAAGVADGLTNFPSDDALVSVTDITHGRAELWLLGAAAPELLSRLCGLDFHEKAFPNLTAGQSRVAKTNQIILRRDLKAGALRAYALVGDRSLAAYLWDTILEAGEDLGIAPAGLQVSSAWW